MINLKKELYQKCLDYVQTRIAAAKQAIEDSQAAANDETKSSAGDKYETGREMMQQETDRNMAQLNEANKLKVALSQIKPVGSAETVEAGSLAITDNGSFYLAISAGVLTVNNDKYYAVSPASPIGLKLKGLKPGNKFTLNEKSYLIKEVI
ncbi:MAG TPA: 3-oxoacyl-ACP synthase [Mucilaginibacter sp.]|jgi:LPS O-antigen subunit length determinant protein (WzzB/FepE family)|nr:3-oxoacyl-ACP synthase [Mucilaginibacter sp.]